MAATWYGLDITDFNILTRSKIKEIGAVVDPDASPYPWVAYFFRIECTGAAEGTAPDLRGAMRLQNDYTDDTLVNIATSGNPFRDVVPGANSDRWYIVELKSTGSNDRTVLTDFGPGATTPAANSLLITTARRWTYQSTKTLEGLNFYWTND